MRKPCENHAKTMRKPCENLRNLGLRNFGSGAICPRPEMSYSCLNYAKTLRKPAQAVGLRMQIQE